MSFTSTPSFELVLDDDVPSQSSPTELALLAESAFRTLVANEPLDSVRDAFSALVLNISVPDDFDASTFNLATRCALEYITPEGQRGWSIRPTPTSPYGMGLSFETSGWRAPAYRSPECREIESRCINPALLLGDAVEAGVAPAEQILDFETPAAVDVDVDVDFPGDSSEDEDDDSEDMDNDGAADSDFEEVSKRSRVIRPLPRRTATRPATPRSTSPFPRASAPVSKKSASTKKKSTRGVPASTATSTAGKKRKADSASARRPSKKAVVSRSFQLPHIPGVTDPGLPAPANSGNVSATYWPLLRLGCEVVSGGVQCNIKGCSHQTNCWGDMGRHVPAVHFRRQGPQFRCDACPRTFARSDARQRHLFRKQARGDHFTAARKAFLLKFNKRADVVAKRNNCPGDSEAYKRLNTELGSLVPFTVSPVHYRPPHCFLIHFHVNQSTLISCILPYARYNFNPVALASKYPPSLIIYVSVALSPHAPFSCTNRS
ncbi:hypothetical protein MSAN_00150400 [Mycena sanguinolenta]|uniref:Uncharacterized protein n=1 Tax=Mycena sanguinolenta TaxID=230812 RepID=A0A8H6ZKS1_9AGAR|nr:hypothetical protein MSAN_00150400 [Mycena sanguinolenta]